MTSQFNERLEGYVYTAAADDAADPGINPSFPAFVRPALISYLSGLELNKRFPGNPLIKVVAVDESTVTFLIRGRMELLKGAVSPFVRTEVRVAKTNPGIEAVETFIAELAMKETETVPVTEVHIGLGFDGLIFSGRGGARVTPIGFGLDVFLGGVSDRGIMIGIDVFLPAAIPLGPIPFGLNGIGGDYAHNFRPRIEAGLEAEGPKLNLETGEGGEEASVEQIENPTATHYLQWARNPDDALDRWVEAPEGETAIGIGLRAFFVDCATNGALVRIEPLGFAVLTPGPVIILGGAGKLMSAEAIDFDAMAVLDVGSGSFSLGGGAAVKVPPSGAMVEGSGTFEAYVSGQEPATWFIRIGAEQDPAKAKFLANYEAKLYLDLNHHRIAFGLEIAWKEGVKLRKILEVFVKLVGGIRGLIGYNPRQLAAELKLKGEAGFKVWKFKLTASFEVGLFGHVPRPRILQATTQFKLNLPFGIEDVKIKVKLPKEFENQAPEVDLPYTTVNGRAGALHGPSGRQWDFVEPAAAPDLPWPDSVLAVPFRARLIDETGKVMGPVIEPEQQGGYDVAHRMTRLDLVDIETGAPVEGVQAVWAEGPDGKTPQLHVLGQDPYSWLQWNQSVSSALSVPDPVHNLQFFGIGPDKPLGAGARFGRLRVTPAGAATLSNAFGFALPRRVITAQDLTVAFRTAGGIPVAADRIWFYVIEHRPFPTSAAQIEVPGAPIPAIAVNLHPLLGELALVTYELPLPPGTALDSIRLMAGTPFHLYGVMLREVPTAEQTCQEKVILTPGRYALEIDGVTQAMAVEDDVERANPEDQPWSHRWEFDVVAPHSLRPYLKTTTVGDGRIIRPEGLPWNPTLFGIGFPAYRGYRPAIRFNVPYISRIFPTLRLQITYEDEGLPGYSFTAAPTPNGAGETSLLEVSEDFLEWVGCAAPPDEEIDGPLLPASGLADMTLHFDGPAETLQLDSLSCYISRFAGFEAHMALDQSTLTRVYNTEGPQTLSPCLVPEGLGFTGRRSIGRSRIERVLTTRPTPPRPGGPLLPPGGPVFGSPTFPDELALPPAPWRLPPALTGILTADMPLAIAFARFARATGAVFSALPENPNFGLANPVEQTTVEAVVDPDGRPYALWLRTPEPVDWRRVEGSLRIRHLTGERGCATELAFRRPMDLSVEILPGPDASSAFIVGALGGIRTRLPRGEYELTLAFDPRAEGLTRLRPGPAIGGPEETAVLRFLQISGVRWPLPGDPVAIPAVLLEHLVGSDDPDRPALHRAANLAEGARDESMAPIRPAPVSRARPLAARGLSPSPGRLRRRPRVNPTDR